METRPVQFSFKGKRQYVTGADMFNAVFGAYPAALLHRVHFTIYGILRTGSCDIYESDSPAALDLGGAKARATFDVAASSRWVALLESTRPDPSRREEYAEDRIISLCHVEDQEIVIDGESPFTFIETVVAMNKYLHQKLFADAIGQWMFVGIELSDGCDAREGLSLHIGQGVNYRLTRSQVLLENKPIGSLLFSLIRP